MKALRIDYAGIIVRTGRNAKIDSPQPIETHPVPLSPAIASFVRKFHAHKPTRIWSLIVTLYGDAVVPRGGSLWIGSLIDIMALFDIDAGHVRTAISRLSSDGWLSRVKRGRASYYRLSKRGRGRVPRGDAADLFRRAEAL